jgi:hypothetical protein
MVLLEKCVDRSSLGRNRSRWKAMLKRKFYFEWKEIKWIGLSQVGENLLPVAYTVTNFFFRKGGGD